MVTIQVRRDTKSNWYTSNPTPVSGEPCYETDTGRTKVGDGSTTYKDLEYIDGEHVLTLDTEDLTTIKGGLPKNIAAATGDIPQTTSGQYIESSEFFVIVSIAGSASLEFDNDVLGLSGVKTVRFEHVDASGRGNASIGSPTYDPLLLRMKPSTKYRLGMYVKTEGVATNSVFFDIRNYDADGVAGSTIISTQKLTGDNDWTYLVREFTTEADCAQVMFRMQHDVDGNAGAVAWFDLYGAKLEEISSSTVDSEVVVPASVSITGVTTIDNISYSQDGVSAGGTSVGQTSTQERAIDLYANDVNISGISIHKDNDIGTFTGTVTFSIYETTSETGDITGNALSSYTMSNIDWLAISDDTWEFINVPCKLDTTKHYALVIETSTVDDANYIKINSASYSGNIRDRIYNGSVWSDASFMSAVKLHFAKHTESPVVSANGSSLDLTGVKLLTGAKVTVDKDGSGMYQWGVNGDNSVQFGIPVGTIDDWVALMNDALSVGSETVFTDNVTEGFLQELGSSNVCEAFYEIDTTFISKSIRLQIRVFNGFTVSWSNDGVTYMDIETTTNSGWENFSYEGIVTSSNVVYIKLRSVVASSGIQSIKITADLDCTSAQLPIMSPSTEVSSVGNDLSIYPIDISEGEYLSLTDDLRGWSSRTITMLSTETLFKSQNVGSDTIYVYDSNGTSAWTWDTRNGLVPPSDRTSGTVLVSYKTGDNQILTQVNDGSMQADISLTWEEPDVKGQLANVTRRVNMPIDAETLGGKDENDFVWQSDVFSVDRDTESVTVNGQVSISSDVTDADSPALDIVLASAEGTKVNQSATLGGTTNYFEPAYPTGNFNRGSSSRGACIRIGNSSGAGFVYGTKSGINTYGTITTEGDTFLGGFTIEEDVNNDACIRLGTYYIWVDSTGDLRIKSSVPTSDTDGTIVGTQS